MTFKVNFITHLPCLQMQLLVCLQNVSSRPPSSRTTSRPTGVQVTSGEITQQARDFTGYFIAAIIVIVHNPQCHFHFHRLTGSLTSHGELCTDTCEKRGYPYFWCHKVNLIMMALIMMMIMLMIMLMIQESSKLV